MRPIYRPTSAAGLRSYPPGAPALLSDSPISVHITILQRPLPIRASIAAANSSSAESIGMGMTEPQEIAALEREEIALRVANFKATQQKFERERDEFFVTTLRNARHSESARRPEPPPLWSLSDR